jgi:hypothetical protein
MLHSILQPDILIPHFLHFLTACLIPTSTLSCWLNLSWDGWLDLDGFFYGRGEGFSEDEELVVDFFLQLFHWLGVSGVAYVG